jgi:hypothetical protein
MRTTARRATRDRLTQRNNDNLSDDIGGTITGGPLESIDLIKVLERSSRGVTRGGAVSGAAKMVAVSSPGATSGQDRGIALSDGSRIYFISIADVEVLKDDDAPIQRAREIRGERRAHLLSSV